MARKKHRRRVRLRCRLKKFPAWWLWETKSLPGSATGTRMTCFVLSPLGQPNDDCGSEIPQTALGCPPINLRPESITITITQFSRVCFLAAHGVCSNPNVRPETSTRVCGPYNNVPGSTPTDDTRKRPCRAHQGLVQLARLARGTAGGDLPTACTILSVSCRGNLEGTSRQIQACRSSAAMATRWKPVCIHREAVSRNVDVRRWKDGNADASDRQRVAILS
jgi:hypothetical protein